MVVDIVQISQSARNVLVKPWEQGKTRQVIVPQKILTDAQNKFYALWLLLLS